MPFDLVLRCVACGRLKTLPREAWIYADDFGGIVCTGESCTNMMASGYDFFDLIRWQGACCVLKNWRMTRAAFEQPPIVTKQGRPTISADKLQPNRLIGLIYACPRCKGETRIMLTDIQSTGMRRVGSRFKCVHCGFTKASEIEQHRVIFGAALRFNEWTRMVGQWFEVFPAELSVRYPERAFGVRNARNKPIAEEAANRIETSRCDYQEEEV